MPSAIIDFTDTEGTGRLKEGTYRARLESVEQKEGREYPLWVWTFTSVEPESAGKQSQHTTSLSPKAAYFVRQVLEALGAEIPSSATKIVTEHYLGREAMILVIQDGTFEGKDGQQHPSYKIDRVFPAFGSTERIEPAYAAPADPRDQVGFSNDSDDIPF